jgi:hypothetical protein
MNDKPKKYNNNIQTFNTGQRVNSQCAEVTFVNNTTVAGLGSQVIINNGLILAPGDSIAFDGKHDELDTTIYQIDFDQTGGNTFNNCVMIRKLYNG